ncbi:hypothetical protein ACIBCR_03445 [Micromonospora echinospora]|uniref:hypothetical protein n=1 Tax=Micromonospora echinospora TaxID=1877 RepID=UPI0037B567CF
MPREHEVERTAGQRNRPPWEWIAAAVSVTALLVSLGAWLLPDSGGWICDKTDDRFVRCNDVPGEFVGTWTGEETCVGTFLAQCVHPKHSLTLKIRRAKVGQQFVESMSELDGKLLCRSSWTLTEVGDGDREVFLRKHHTIDEGESATGEPITCSDGLTATVALTGPDAIRVDTKGTAITDTGLHFNAELSRT